MFTEVKILTTISTSNYGTLEQDSILRTSDEYAKRLVDVLGVAEYVNSVVTETKKTTKK